MTNSGLTLKPKRRVNSREIEKVSCGGEEIGKKENPLDPAWEL